MDIKSGLEKYNEIIEREGVKFLDIKVANLSGQLKHFTIPASKLDKKLFKEGIGADGSSVGGYATVESSDLRLVPDIDTGFLDPFFPQKTLSFLCNVTYAAKDGPFPLCPRQTAIRATGALKELGIADESYWIPELEFFIFDGYTFDTDPMRISAQFYSCESTDKENFGYKFHKEGGYGAVPPFDKGLDIRTELTDLIEKIGIDIKVSHHECGVPGQHEFELDFKPLLRSCDEVILAKYFIRNIAARYNKVATFMPKPLYRIAGSGMHVHQLLKKNGKNIFSGNKYVNFSETGLYYIGGILEHIDAITGLANPSTNSYKRLVPGYEAPTAVCYSPSNRTSAIRIPGYIRDPEVMRFEYRPADATCNPYFMLSSLVCAGIEGVLKKTDPGAPAEGNIEARKDIKKLPQSLGAALEALEKGHEFLTSRGVFSKEAVERWVEVKSRESALVSECPNPAEIDLYFNC